MDHSMFIGGIAAGTLIATSFAYNFACETNERIERQRYMREWTLEMQRIHATRHRPERREPYAA